MKKLKSVDYHIQLHKENVANGFGKYIFLSDLHSCCDDEETENILRSIEEFQPDCILCGGDSYVAVNGQSADRAVTFMCLLQERWPVYHAYGNHEERSKKQPQYYGDIFSRFAEPLTDAGVIFLDNESRSVQLGSLHVRVAGLSIDRRFYRNRKKIKQLLTKQYMTVDEVYGKLNHADSKEITLLLAHNPAYMKTYAEWGADITMCGHYHGGVCRLGRHHGLVSPELHPFPGNVYGHYIYDAVRSKCVDADTFLKKNPDESVKEVLPHIIVTSGAGEHTMPIRIHNPREIVRVIIENHKE